MKKVIGIYKITSPSGRIYIGQSIDVFRRLSKYSMPSSSSKQPKLFKSIQKYGISLHNKELLEECKFEDLNIRERYYQELFDCIENGLNCIYTDTSEKPKRCSNETRQKMSKNNCRYWLGRKLTQEQKDNIAEKNRINNTGKVLSQQTKDKIRNSLLGNVISEETKLKISKANKGKIVNKEGRINISNGKKVKLILNLQTGIYYDCIQDAAFAHGYHRDNFTNHLNRKYKKYNNEDFIYA